MKRTTQCTTEIIHLSSKEALKLIQEAIEGPELFLRMEIMPIGGEIELRITWKPMSHQECEELIQGLKKDMGL